MATIDYKQKIKDYMNSSEVDTLYKSMLTNLFPELKESEDERIKKAIIEHFAGSHSSMYPYKGFTKEQIIAWLEKQYETFTKKDVDDAYLKGVCDAKHELEKQGKKKPIDKVEPKFHEGDWVILTAGELSTMLQIVKVDTNKKLYWFNDSSYLPIVDEEFLHLWTIEDANDGDVLACPLPKGYEAGEQIFIFKGIKSRRYVDNCIEYYCRVCEGVFYKNKNCYMGTTSSTLYPATKEQHDTLMKAMADAGYMWDAEKKELKKIGQKPAETEKGAKGNDREIPNSEPPLTLKHAREVMGIKQDTAWSEEDEMFVHGLIRGLAAMKNIHGHTTFSSDNIDITKTIDWLESLKERYTWRPSDEQMKVLNEVLNFAANHESLHWNDYIFGTLNNLIRQLKKLREE